VHLHLYSTSNAFAALKADGSIKAWGNLSYGAIGFKGSKGKFI
jgi:hypothetical protein